MNTCVQCIYRRCVACSELRSVRVSVHCGVHAVVHDVLEIVEVVREDVRSFPVAIVCRKMFVNIRCRMYSICMEQSRDISSKHWRALTLKKGHRRGLAKRQQ